MLAGREKATEREQEPESSSLQRQKASRNLKVPGSSERKRQKPSGT
ncbi:hypothetical protein A2U01_0074702 [Trifolium medium]|uniref:Uncharacterized protein n=1 Tax=Trifolium medium TaxID=97028 RepID=A0A392SZF8_9FABA|nr:hypothetical protein [Trifolium medium]